MSQLNRDHLKPELAAAPLAAQTQVQAHAATAALFASAPFVSFQGKTAMLVEDSWLNAAAMKSLLENTGLTVIGPAARLEVAEAMLVATTPDIAVVDVNLHGKLALGLIDRLNERHVPVIVVTGYEQVDGLEGKVAAFLTKPVRSRVLIAALQSALAQRTIC
jgi:DNA-binding response OmpR family regulator